MNLRTLARRASRRARLLALERSLLREATRALGVSVALLLAAAAALALLDLRAPAGDEARIAALAAAGALVASGLALGVKRGLERRTTDLEAAFALDRWLGLAGALPAALELEARPEPFARLAVEAVLERARGVDLAGALPRTAPPEAPAAPWLFLATLALAFLVGTRPALPEPLPRVEPAKPRPEAERRDLADAATVLARAAGALAPEARDVEASLGSVGAAGLAVAELDRLGRRLARGTTTAAGALAGIADARGRIEAAREPGLAEGLEAAGEALALAPAAAPLARGLAAGDARAVREAGRDLAEQLRSGALTEDARAQVAAAAGRAARALEGSGSGADARATLENLGRALDQAKDPGREAEAATSAADALARARESARAEQVAQRAQDALDEARDAARGRKPADDRSKPGEGGRANGEPRPGREAPSSKEDGGLARKGSGDRGGRDGGAGGHEERAGTQPGSGSGADERPGNKGDPAGSGLGSHVAGKGGTNEEDASGGARPDASPEATGAPSTLRGLLGSRGASAVFAVRGVARGEALAPRSRDLVQDYRRTEEAALDRELVPADRRRLVRRYFETTFQGVPETRGGDR